MITPTDDISTRAFHILKREPKPGIAELFTEYQDALKDLESRPVVQNDEYHGLCTHIRALEMAMIELPSETLDDVFRKVVAYFDSRPDTKDVTLKPLLNEARAAVKAS